MPIQVRHINYVIAATDHGSFRKAAAALGVQESAISRRIRDLEERLGVALFVRSHSGVRLTLAGKQFVDRGRKALSEITLAKTEVAAISRVGGGELKIGILSSLGSGFLSGLIRTFGESYGAVKMSFVDGDQSEHVAAILARAAEQSQVIVFSHHAHLINVANQAIGKDGFKLHIIDPAPAVAAG